MGEVEKTSVRPRNRESQPISVHWRLNDRMNQVAKEVEAYIESASKEVQIKLREIEGPSGRRLPMRLKASATGCPFTVSSENRDLGKTLLLWTTQEQEENCVLHPSGVP